MVRYPLSETLGRHLVAGRKARGLSQRAMAARVQRTPGRIAEMESDLLRGRTRRDRLTLLLDMCDSLDLVPVLVPRAQAREVEALHGLGRAGTGAPAAAGSAPRVFDEVFVDLGDDEDEAGGGAA
jgi:transcriptional regulator with XRE-family HTH domain